MQDHRTRQSAAARAALAALEEAWAYYDPATEGKVVPLRDTAPRAEGGPQYYEAA